MKRWLWRHSVWILASILMAFTIVSALGAVSPTPTDRVRNAVDLTRKILENDQLDRGATKERVINGILRANFDVPGISQAVLGVHWPKHQLRVNEFSSAFIFHLANLFVEKVPAEIVRGAPITYRSEKIDSDGSRAKVFTHLLVNYKGKDYKLYVTFTVVFKDGEWRIYNIAIRYFGDFVSHFRREINDILGNSSFDELIVRLKKL